MTAKKSLDSDVELRETVPMNKNTTSTNSPFDDDFFRKHVIVVHVTAPKPKADQPKAAS